MAKKSIEARLAELDARRASLKARLDKQERASDTRRKVLLGAFVLHKMESGRDEEFARRLGDWLRRELPTFLTRDGDKALFTDLIGAQPPANGRAMNHAGTDIGGDDTPGASNEHAEATSHADAGWGRTSLAHTQISI